MKREQDARGSSRGSITDTMHWVDKYLVPRRGCSKAVMKARDYPDPQSAWDAWGHGGDLLWVLHRTSSDPIKRVLCACDIAERVLPIFERVRPKDQRPRKAIESTRRYMREHTEENKHHVYEGVTRANAAWRTVGDRTAEAVRAALFAAYSAYGAGCVAWHAHVAAYHAHNAVNDAAEHKAQADIVRMYFPTAPIPTESEVTNG